LKVLKKEGSHFLFGGKYEKKNISKFGYTNKKDLILSHVDMQINVDKICEN
jgi:hypothetical protein